MNAQILKNELETVRLTDTVHEHFFEKLKTFEKVILRGAGGFGNEIGSQLLKHGLKASQLVYWDIRASEIKQLHGINVVEPFTTIEEKDKTLIIHCIPNGSLSGSTILREMHEQGYTEIIDGMALFESAFCKMRAETGYEAKNCLETTVCNWTNCERLLAFSERDCGNANLKGSNDVLSFQVMDIFMSFKCTLGCKDCGAYMNVYADKGLDQHVSYEQITHDMDLFFDAIDTVAFVSVVGGEPFLHPQFSQVIEKILEKPNFGVLGITTSGICKISDKALKVLKNERTRVIFSDYTQALTEKQQALFNENVKKVSEYGIYYTVGEPVWATTPSLSHTECSDEQLVSMKQNCTSTKTCQALLNGRLYPCSTTLAIHELHADDYSLDYISLDSKNLRETIKALHNQPYYESCKRCTDGGVQVEQSGIQARDRRFDHLLDGIHIAVEASV